MTETINIRGPLYIESLAALDEAHAACLDANSLTIKIREAMGVGFNATGMSHGPFSGVNKVLGIIQGLETENAMLWREVWMRTCQ